MTNSAANAQGRIRVSRSGQGRRGLGEEALILRPKRERRENSLSGDGHFMAMSDQGFVRKGGSARRRMRRVGEKLSITMWGDEGK